MLSPNHVNVAKILDSSNFGSLEYYLLLKFEFIFKLVQLWELLSILSTVFQCHIHGLTVEQIFRNIY